MEKTCGGAGMGIRGGIGGCKEEVFILYSHVKFQKKEIKQEMLQKASMKVTLLPPQITCPPNLSFRRLFIFLFISSLHSLPFSIPLPFSSLHPEGKLHTDSSDWFLWHISRTRTHTGMPIYTQTHTSPLQQRVLYTGPQS